MVYADAAAKHALSVLERYDFNEDIPEWNDEGTISTEERVLITQSMKEVNQIMEAYVGHCPQQYPVDTCLEPTGHTLRGDRSTLQAEQGYLELCELRNTNKRRIPDNKASHGTQGKVRLHYTIDYPHAKK